MLGLDLLDLDLLEWAVRALSLFNTVAFLWLGLTVLLNAERRALGTWVTGSGLLLAGLFFASHSTLVGRDLSVFYGLTPAADLEFWWRVGWLLFVSPPYMWYVVVAWYSGLLGARAHRFLVLAVGLLGLGAASLLAFAGLLPAYREIAQPSPVTIPSFVGVPVVALIYPAYSTLCIVLSLDALRRPAASKRLMGDLARRRARPWLIATSLVLLIISLSVGGVVGWLLHWVQWREVGASAKPTLTLLLVFDLAISVLLAAVAVFLGRAIVSYEIFTGKPLPRGGLLLHWRRSLLLAAGYGGLLASSLALPVEPIYHLLLATILMVGFFALLSWRTFVEREQSLERLRPFVASQRLYEHLSQLSDPQGVDLSVPFRGLCDDVLGARVAYLAAVGPMAPLAGPALTHPTGVAAPLGELIGLADRLRVDQHQRMCVPLDPDRLGGAVWGIPLWGQHGLIGVLLLGERRDGRLYVQEEIEIARAACERLVDTRASAEMARRLMTLQRRRLAETRVLDRHARRVLHDDVLPRLHAALLTLASEDRGTSSEAVETLVSVHRGIAELLRELPATPAPELARLGLIGALRQTVEGELRGAFDDVVWRVEPEAERAAHALSPLVAEVVFGAAREAIRNAARHGRGAEDGRRLRLVVSVAQRDGLEVVVEDDGVGLGGTGAAQGGSGQGLALHSTMMAVVGGVLTAEGQAGHGSRVALLVPADVALGGNVE